MHAPASLLKPDHSRHPQDLLRTGIVALSLLAACSFSPAQQPGQSIASIQTLIRARQYEPALQEINAQLKTAPNDVRLWTLDGIVFSLQGNTLKALNAFDKALALSPNYIAALQGEVQLYNQTRDKRAIPLLERIVKVNPDDQTAHEMLGLLEAKQGHCEAANAHFLVSAQTIVKHPASLEAYGSCQIVTQQFEKAITTFEQLAALLPDRTYPKYNLAVAQVGAKQDTAAIKVLDPLLASDPSDPEILSLASDAYEHTGNTPRAVALLRQAIILAPANAPYYTAFAALCLDHESFQVGIDVITVGLQHITNDSSLYIARGMLYAQLAQYDRAEADFKQAEAFDTGQSISSYATDLAELQKNNPDSAMAKIRLQLQAHPDSALLHYLLAKLLSTHGADTDPKVFHEAEKEALTAVKLKPDLTEARDLLATMYSHAEQYKPAIEQCRLALKSNPNDQTAIYHLIIALRHAGQGDQRAEIQGLVQRLADLQKTSRQKETDRKRFKLEEQQAASQ